MFSEHTPTLVVSNPEGLQQRKIQLEWIHQKLVKNITKNTSSRAMGPILGPIREQFPGAQMRRS
jgi:hypothetical protein